MLNGSLPLIAFCIALVQALPALNVGFMGDDYFHRELLLGHDAVSDTSGLDESDVPMLGPLESTQVLFAFFDESGDRLEWLRQQGYVPWWTENKVKVSFWRPLSALTHWLDYQLWPDSPTMMHLHSALWYGLMVSLAVIFFRQYIKERIVIVIALFLFVLDLSHFMPLYWLANRNIIIAASFTLLCIISHHQWRSENNQKHLLLSLLSAALALLAAEAGVVAGAFVLSYAITMDDSSWGKRLSSVLPIALLILSWQVVYRSLGFGSSDNGLYLDPFADPIDFILTVSQRIPILLFSQFTAIDHFPQILSPEYQPLLSLASLAVLGLFMWFAWPLLLKDKSARFLSLATLMAIIPVCSMLAGGGRLLWMASLVAAPFVAKFLSASLWHSVTMWPSKTMWRMGKTTAGLAITVHLILMMLAWVIISLSVVLNNNLNKRSVTDFSQVNDLAGKQLMVVNAPDPFSLAYVLLDKKYRKEPSPEQLTIMAPGYESMTLTIIDDHQIRLSGEKSFMMNANTLQGRTWDDGPIKHLAYYYRSMSSVFNSIDFKLRVGQEFNMSGYDVVIEAVDQAQEATSMLFRFDRVLSDESMVFVIWDWKKRKYLPLEEFQPGDIILLPGV